MKFAKKAFSLAELLLCIAIISIITAMGITIGKQSTEKAYNLYFYTGFTNLWDAIYYLENNDFYYVNPADENHSDKGITSTPIFRTKLNNFFNGKPPSRALADGGTTVVTENGIRYSIGNRDANNIYPILMSVPCAKTRAFPNGERRAQLYYDKNHGILIPGTDGDVDLQRNISLLPTFIQRGDAVEIVNDDGTTTFRRRIYYSFRDSYCTLNRPRIILSDGTTVITCNDGTFAETAYEIGRSNNGAIMFESPNKI